jgi:hypothetical protein
MEPNPEIDNLASHIQTVKKSNKPKNITDFIIVEDDDVSKDDKQTIINQFMVNVKGKEISIQNNGHCGGEGHWLETQMGIRHNANNEPDILGYEMKTGNSKTTFIDKAPDIMFLNGKILNKRNKSEKNKYWDQYASKKKSDDKTLGGWSINHFNKDGQKMMVDDQNNITVLYDYNYDTRVDKETLELNKEPHIIAQWNAASLKSAIENKFNKKGFFKCKKENDVFIKICFGKCITFDMWIEGFKNGVIYHDGYSRVNGRGRHVFRAANSKFWDTLITEEY